MKDLISPIIDAGFDMQCKIWLINLNNVDGAKYGVRQTCVWVNAVTANFHIEDDCSSIHNCCT